VKKITVNEFNKYKNICDIFILFLSEQGYSSIYDFHTILKIISGFPYCLDCDGHYSYKGKFYNSMQDLPLEALHDLVPS